MKLNKKLLLLSSTVIAPVTLFTISAAAPVEKPAEKPLDPAQNTTLWTTYSKLYDEYEILRKDNTSAKETINTKAKELKAKVAKELEAEVVKNNEKFTSLFKGLNDKIDTFLLKTTQKSSNNTAWIYIGVMAAIIVVFVGVHFLMKKRNDKNGSAKIQEHLEEIRSEEQIDSTQSSEQVQKEKDDITTTKQIEEQAQKPVEETSKTAKK